MAIASKILQLRTVPGAWRSYSAHKADPRLRDLHLKVLKRDQYTCQYCGFQAKKYQEVLSADGNYANVKIDNLITVCCFCAQCFFIESVGLGGYGGGSLIYLPELSQSELNSLCHVLFCAITNDTGYKTSAQDIYRSLKSRTQYVEDHFGEGSSSPSILGQLIIDSGAHTPDMLSKIFHDVRLLPSRAKFRKQIEHWAASALEEITEK